MLYCQLVPGSSPATSTAPTLVIPSVALLPLSTATFKLGAMGATVSTVMVRSPCAEVLPAASVAVTDSVWGPSPIAAKSSVVSA